MNCLQCNKPFDSDRDDAKYCSPKCRKAASRNKNKPDLVKIVIPKDKLESPNDKTNDGTNFIPNWKKNGFQSKEEATLNALALVMKRVPNAVITWNDKTWTKDNFSKNMLTKVELKVNPTDNKK